VSFTETLFLVLAGVYGLTSLVLSAGVAVGWHAGLERRGSTSGELLALRLLPSVGAAFLTLTIVLPAFCLYEPRHETEQAGPLLVALTLLALLGAGHGVLRGWRAWAATRALLSSCGLSGRGEGIAGVDIVDVPEPLVAVVGGWRPRVLAAHCVRAACSDEEFRQVLAHEAAHVASHDNLKLLLLLISPDVLAWMPAGNALTKRWRAAAELEADARASGGDPCKRVALASALIKVARLSSGAPHRSAVLSMPVAFDDVQGRVCALLAPPSPVRSLDARALIAGTLMIGVAAALPYGLIQELVESLVAFGR
jgi:Zn-dependent protease with chaperone function